MKNPVALIVIDGWGLGEKYPGNPIFKAKLPTIEKLDERYPCVAVQASGISVGLPWGEPGNSEVGHMSLGTGQVIYQNFPRITMAIQSGEFFKNPALLKAVDHAKETGGAIHLMGLVGKGGVHSSADHLYALLEMMRDQKAEKVFVHAFTDGRDSAPTSGVECIHELLSRFNMYKVGKLATIGGRYYGMDRNNNWDRIQKAYDSMTKGEGPTTDDPIGYLQKSYAKEVFDEYLEPAVVTENGQPVAKIQKGDSVIFFNFREDRARQITKAFVLPGFDKFPREKIDNLLFATMVSYEDDLPVDVAFPPIEIKICLSSVLSEHGKKQLRIAETEKFAHVTYFFNGGNEEPYPGEDRIIIPSKNVASFDEAPEMSAPEITARVTELIEADKYDFILLNFANADIVGHTGNLEAGIKAIETVDKCLEKIIKEVLLRNGCLLITADHGNVEEMINVHTGEKDTEHSANPVPLWFVTASNHSESKRPHEEPKVAGLLSDIAPTILEIMGIDKPAEMTGESLLDVLK